MLPPKTMKIERKIDQISIEMAVRGPSIRPSRSKWVVRSRWRHPRPSKWVHRGRSRRPRSVELVRGERPGVFRGAARRPKSTRSRVQEVQTREFLRTARSRTIVRAIFRRKVSIFGIVATSANPLKYRACQQKRRFGTSCCTSSRSHDLPLKNDENRSQNRCKVDRSGSFGARRGAQVDRSGSFGPVEAPKSIEVDR